MNAKGEMHKWERGATEAELLQQIEVLSRQADEDRAHWAAVEARFTRAAAEGAAIRRLQDAAYARMDAAHQGLRAAYEQSRSVSAKRPSAKETIKSFGRAFRDWCAASSSAAAAMDSACDFMEEALDGVRTANMHSAASAEVLQGLEAEAAELDKRALRGQAHYAGANGMLQAFKAMRGKGAKDVRP